MLKLAYSNLASQKFSVWQRDEEEGKDQGYEGMEWMGEKGRVREEGPKINLFKVPSTSVVIVQKCDETCCRLSARLLAPAVQPAIHDSHHQHLFQLLIDGVHHLPAQVHTVPLRRLGILGQRLHRYCIAIYDAAKS